MRIARRTVKAIAALSTTRSRKTRTVVKKPRILIAEDEDHLREILRFQLEASGFEVQEARDGKQAVESATENPPDVALLDVMMPHLDGFQVCKRLRNSFRTRHVPIIMLTAKSEADDKIAGLSGGANDFLTKPWEQRELVLRVRNVLEWSRQQRSASPLTGLPGNLSINDEVSARLELRKPFAELLIDIDYFKSFNDRYGYSRGDQAIQAVARILVETTRDHGGDENFVGHIGGDDFVVLAAPERAEAIGREIISRFDAVASTLYDEADRNHGYIEVPNRRHKRERFPLMTLTIALVSTDRMPVSHLAELADIAQELKARGKSIQGSALVGDRRDDAHPAAERRSAA
jgi:diguanylate cyclase (GGDEF)-like protein